MLHKLIEKVRGGGLTAQALKDKRRSIMSLFEKTKEELILLQAEQNCALQQIDEEIDKLAAERSAILEDANGTVKTIDKINEFLS